MAQPYMAEIRLLSFSFPPRNWALCNGQTLNINSNQALFSLLGVNYGGNGTTNFALPDLRGRFPIHVGTGAGLPTYVVGQRGGAEIATLNSTTSVVGSGASGATTAVGFSPDQAVPVMTPFLALNFAIALTGVFPSQN
jgi:microcystin-dependent protein